MIKAKTVLDSLSGILGQVMGRFSLDHVTDEYLGLYESLSS